MASSVRLVLILLGIAVMGLVQAQTLGQRQPKHIRATAKASDFVTSSEVQITLDRVRKAVRKIMLNQKSVNETKQPTRSNRPATRAEIVQEFAKLYSLSEPSFKFNPKPFPIDRAILSIPAGKPGRTELEKLILKGCIDPFGPLATSTGVGISPEQFGDSLGFLIARLCDLSHTPSTKFSPDLMGGDQSAENGSVGTDSKTTESRIRKRPRISLLGTLCPLVG